jgi:hypothetical protein
METVNWNVLTSVAAKNIVLQGTEGGKLRGCCMPHDTVATSSGPPPPPPPPTSCPWHLATAVVWHMRTNRQSCGKGPVLGGAHTAAGVEDPPVAPTGSGAGHRAKKGPGSPRQNGWETPVLPLPPAPGPRLLCALYCCMRIFPPHPMV